jgi:hypothetical protein
MNEPAGRLALTLTLVLAVLALAAIGPATRLAHLFSGYESGGRIGALRRMTPLSARSCAPWPRQLAR